MIQVKVFDEEHERDLEKVFILFKIDVILSMMKQSFLY